MGKLESARRAVHVWIMDGMVVGRLRPLGRELCMVLAAEQVVRAEDNIAGEEMREAANTKCL
jgi:hypothetical protein